MKKCKVFDSMELFDSALGALQDYNDWALYSRYRTASLKSLQIRGLANHIDQISLRIKDLTLCPSTLVQSVRNL